MKLKKIFCVIVLFIVLINFSNPIFADNEDVEEVNVKEIQENISQVSANIESVPTINSRAAILYERNSKQIIYGKSENVARPMASTTKIMTCMIVLENADLNEVVEVSKRAGGTGGSRLGLKAGDKITVHDLLYGLMLCSRK